MSNKDCGDGDAFIKYSVKEKLESIEEKLDKHLEKEERQDKAISTNRANIAKNSTSISYLKGFCVLIIGTILTSIIKIWLFP